MPNRHHTFVRDEVLPSWWANAIQAVLSTLAENFRIEKQDATTIRVPAGAGDDLSAIAIDGRWRYVEANVTRAHPGGAAATYDIHVTTAENVIVNAPLPNTDNTNYAFALAITAHNAQPPIVAGVVDFARKVGELAWDGAQITAITQLVGSAVLGNDPRLSDARTPLAHAASHRLGGTDPIGVASLTAQTVREVGQTGQIKAGHTLAATDFTDLGLAAPAGGWNLSNVNDFSGGARNLTNKGSVQFGTGILGAGFSCAAFSGSTAQALFVSDLGAGDSLRIKTGTWGCWFRTAKRGTTQTAISKWRTTGNLRSYSLAMGPLNTVAATVSTDGAATVQALGTSDIADDRWHFLAATFDGTTLRVFVDGVLEGSAAIAGTLFTGAAPFVIGGYDADAGTLTSEPCWGRIDEAFVTPDVLAEDQIRSLYSAKIAHGYSVAPTAVQLLVNRLRRGAPFVVGDFPVAPDRIYNFTAASLADTSGNNVAVAPVGGGAITDLAGADGTRSGSQSFSGAHTGLAGSDAGLSAGTSQRSFGAWFKTSATGAVQDIMSWGTTGTALQFVTMRLSATGTFGTTDTTNTLDSAASYNDGQWHFGVIVEDNAAADGLKTKCYVDGRLVAVSVTLFGASLVLAGANGFRVGSRGGANPWAGQIDGVFVDHAALTSEQVWTLFAKSGQALGKSPKASPEHVERIDATSIYAIHDLIEPQDQIDLVVAA